MINYYSNTPFFQTSLIHPKTLTILIFISFSSPISLLLFNPNHPQLSISLSTPYLSYSCPSPSKSPHTPIPTTNLPSPPLSLTLNNTLSYSISPIHYLLLTPTTFSSHNLLNNVIFRGKITLISFFLGFFEKINSLFCHF